MQDLDSPQEQPDISLNRPSFSIYISINLTPTEASQENDSSSNGHPDQQEPDNDFEFATCHNDKIIEFYPVFGKNILLNDGKDHHNNSADACNEGKKAATRTRRRPTLRQLFLEEDRFTSFEVDKLAAGTYCMQSPELTCKKSSKTGWLSWFKKWRLRDFFRWGKGLYVKEKGDKVEMVKWYNYHDKLYVKKGEKRISYLAYGEGFFGACGYGKCAGNGYPPFF